MKDYYIYMCPNHGYIECAMDKDGYTRNCSLCLTKMIKTNMTADEYMHALKYDRNKLRDLNDKLDFFAKIQKQRLTRIKNTPKTEKQIVINKIANMILEYKILMERTDEDRCPYCGNEGLIYSGDEYGKYIKCSWCHYTTQKKYGVYIPGYNNNNKQVSTQEKKMSAESQSKQDTIYTENLIEKFFKWLNK